MNTKFKQFAVAVATLGAFTCALAAVPGEIVLKDVSGQVMVDNGTSYALAHEGVSLNPGTKLLVPAGGAGKIVFNNCVLRLNPNTMATVPANGLCNLVERPYVKVAAAGAPSATAAPAVAGTKLAAWVVPAAQVGAVTVTASTQNSSRQAPPASAL